MRGWSNSSNKNHFEWSDCAKMYKHFFGLRENPFNVNPDPRYLFLTRQLQKAMDELMYGVQSRKGLILLTGEVGTGKTTLINRLLDWLRQRQTPTAFIFNSHLEADHLFHFILADFGVPFDTGMKTSSLMRLNQWLFERYRAGDTPVLIVDEAQGLPAHVLEEIRLLLNLETPREKLLQIVLAGQPELAARLKQPELSQIKQRIVLRCKTAALTLEETHQYIQARLGIAGANGKPVFAPQAMDAVHSYSRGIPRVINLLCEHALVDAYVDNVRPVPAHIVAEVAREFQFDDGRSVVQSVDSADAIDSHLIAAEPASMDLPISMPATVESLWMKQPDHITNRIPSPFAVADNALSSVKEPAAPLLAREEILNFNRDAETSRRPGVLVAMQSAGEQRQIEASRQSGSTAFFFDDGVRPISGLDMKPAPRELPATTFGATKSNPFRSMLMKISTLLSLVGRWGRRWRRLFLSAVASLASDLRTAFSLRRLKRSLRPVRALYRRCLAWRDSCLTFINSLDWPRMKKSVYTWLREPWEPIQWRLPDLRQFDARRRLTQKKM
jgi:general secretion pathway protein A